MTRLISKASREPKRLIFPEGDHPKVARAAQICREEGIANPILLGNPDAIRAVAEENEIPLDGVEIVYPKTDPRMAAFVESYWKQRSRYGVTREEARRINSSRNYFAAMMVENGDADAIVSGMTRSYPDTLRPYLEWCASGGASSGGCLPVILDEGVKIFADTTVNGDPTAEELAEIAQATAAGA